MPSQLGGVNYDSLTVAPADQATGDDYVQGRTILNASRQAYAAIDSYRGSIQVSDIAGFPGGSFPQQRALTVDYEYPRHLQLEGRDSNNDPYVIRIASDSASIDWNGKTQPYESAETAILAFSGITLYGSLILPGCLLDSTWHNETYDVPMNKSFLEACATKARLAGTTSIDGCECYRIVCERETVTWTVYVDAETKLLRRADCEISERQMRQLVARGGGGGSSGNLKAIRQSQSFVIEQVTWIDATNHEGHNGQMVRRGEGGAIDPHPSDDR